MVKIINRRKEWMSFGRWLLNNTPPEFGVNHEPQMFNADYRMYTSSDVKERRFLGTVGHQTVHLYTNDPAIFQAVRDKAEEYELKVDENFPYFTQGEEEQKITIFLHKSFGEI